MTFEVILHFMKNMFVVNVSIHRNFYQNWFINECARRKKAKILESLSFSVRYRRTYVLKIIFLHLNYYLTDA